VEAAFVMPVGVSPASEVAFILSSSKHEAMKLKPRKSSCAFALGGTPGESVIEMIMIITPKILTNTFLANYYFVCEAF